MRTAEILARCRQGKTYEEQQAIALEIYRETHQPPSGQRFVATFYVAIFFGLCAITALAWVMR